jgi:peptidoglycan L-alanyl-D-glutamate endopeptidase CwlK
MLHSLDRAQGVDKRLVAVAERAAEICLVDITVLEGIRSTLRQSELVAAGASQTMDSAHITGEALDLGAMLGGSVRWDWPLYFTIADAMHLAAVDLGVQLKWGGCWDREVTTWTETAEAMSAGYAKRRGMAGKKAFLDGPHWEIWERKPR